MAAVIRCPFDRIEWASDPVQQCLLEDIPHDIHAAFLRSGSHGDPAASDVYLLWRDGDTTQSLADLHCCLAQRTPMSGACTIYKGHPGRCDWQYIDPAQVAAQAQADQLLQEMGLLPPGSREGLPPI
ncbi:hypothetical protein [Streptomyces sp. NBC_00334]|uniref:hypothetical protein n=1 Tax=Streptomyces sp. NBC_00334 TaxID=2975713 RepID=UPI002E289E2C|nr:hypothetical protein [Streptomyces sp. NBC_00334]